MRTVLAAIATGRGGIDRALGRVTAVALIAATLWVVVVAALVLMLVGVLAFDPLAGVLSVIVTVASTAVGAYAGGAIVRATPELESVLVSGLIVFLLFPPRLDAPSLTAVAIAGLIAGASRFLVARLGRHLFNPAALGALVVALVASVLDLAGISFLGGPTWWVATPPLAPVVALGALVVCYRSSVVTVALAYVVVAAAFRTGQLIAFGMPLGDSLATIFGSLPIVFAAGYLLSEPQTLPPRWWQRLLVAGLAALVASVPFSFGPLYSSPELGIVIANVLAWGFGARRAIGLTVTGVQRHGQNVVSLRLRADEPVAHLAGQAIELAVPHGSRDIRGRRRVFSIASAPGAEDLEIAFCVPPHASTAKRALAALSPGDGLRATRVFGDFVAPKVGTDALLVAGGIGITPFLSMLRDADPRHDYVVVYRSSEETPPFLAELEAAGVRVVLSCPVAPEPMPTGWTWLGRGRLVAEDLAAAIPDLPGRVAYVSGPPSMVAALTAALRRAGVRGVRRDVFSGA